MPGSDDTKHLIPFVEESRKALNFEDKFRRIGFTCLLLIIIAALSGLFSSGYFSSSKLVADNPKLQVEYEKFGRLMKDDTLKISLPSPPSGPLTLQLGKDFTASFQIETITPEPDSMRNVNHQLVMEYASTPNAETTVWLTVKPLRPGFFQTTLSANSGAEKVISQFVYP